MRRKYKPFLSGISCIFAEAVMILDFVANESQLTAAPVTAGQIQASFTNTWTQAHYIAAVSNYYAVAHPNWPTYLSQLPRTNYLSRFVLGEVKPCAALYRVTGNTNYAEAIRVTLLALAAVTNMASGALTFTEPDFNYAYYQIRNSPNLSAADKTNIENYIATRMNWMLTQEVDTTFSRGMMNAEALAYAEALILPTNPNAAAWRAWHQTSWSNNLARVMDTTEDASNYHMFWLSCLYEYIRVAGAEMGWTLTNFFNQPTIKNLCERDLQQVSNVGFIPSYGRGGTYGVSGQHPGIFEALATLYRDGRYKAAAQHMFDFERAVVTNIWCGPNNDICAITVFDYVDDTVGLTNTLRPSAGAYNRNLQGHPMPDKVVLCSGTNAADSYVTINVGQGYNHGHIQGSTLCAFLSQSYPLLMDSAMLIDDRVYQNLIQVRSASEAFPYVPPSAGQLGQQYITDNVRRRYAINIRGVGSSNGANSLDPHLINSLQMYLQATLATNASSSTCALYLDNIQAVGPAGTLLLNSSFTATNVFTASTTYFWNTTSVGGTRDLSSYDTVEFGMRIQRLDTNSTIASVLPLLNSANSGSSKFGYVVLDVSSMTATNSVQTFAGMQYASDLINLKDTLGANNVQQRDLMLAPGGILLVRDKVTFPNGETNVQMGPLWNCAQVVNSATNWYDVRQNPGLNIAPQNLLVYYPRRTDSGIIFSNGMAQDPASTNWVVFQMWSGNATNGATRTFNSLLLAHDPATNATSVAAKVQTLECDETATVLQIGTNYLVLNPTGLPLNAGGLRTDAQILYFQASNNVPVYYAGILASNLVYSNTVLFSASSKLPQFQWGAFSGQTFLLASNAPPGFPANAVSVTNGTVSLSVTGVVGAPFTLWATTNLALSPITNTWTKLTNGTVSASPFTITDPGVTTNRQRFYIFSSP